MRDTGIGNTWSAKSGLGKRISSILNKYKGISIVATHLTPLDNLLEGRECLSRIPRFKSTEKIEFWRPEARYHVDRTCIALVVARRCYSEDTAQFNELFANSIATVLIRLRSTRDVDLNLSSSIIVSSCLCVLARFDSGHTSGRLDDKALTIH